MQFLNISFILMATLLCCDLCNGLFFPLLKSLKRSALYGSYAPSYGYRYPQHRYNAGYYDGSSYGRRPHRQGRKRGGRTYSDIARVLNANPYAFVGSQPFPAQPFYPQG